MPTTDTSETGLESLIYRAMTGLPDHPDAPDALHDPGAPYGGAGWIAGNAHDYDREYAVDFAQLHAFLLATQLTFTHESKGGERRGRRQRYRRDAANRTRWR